MRRAEPNGSQPPAVGFGPLARRMRNWAANLVASGVIVVVALVVGRQLIEWWRVEPAGILGGGQSEQADAAGDALPSMAMQFGDAAGQIEHRLIEADPSDLRPQLIADCRRAAADGAPTPGEPDAAERQLLALAESIEPAEVTPAGDRIYCPEQGLPVAVAIRQVGNPDNRHNRSEEPVADVVGAAEPGAEAVGRELGAVRNRVITWNLAVPAGQQSWSLYTFRTGPLALPSGGPPSGMSLPPGSQRTLALRDARGETLIAFSGAGSAGAWQQFFGNWSEAHAFRRVEPWRQDGDWWQTRFRDDGNSWFDLQFGPQAAGGLAGLIRWAPGAEKEK